ncbi:MAG: hypothetical protein JNL83_30220 [Myxococcales bacterium]|nr:hypothetical protein [Myxococcales bacterium]
MNLVEAEEVGPVEGDEPLVTPPRPPHRRVSVSLVFTLTVLIGTVVAIYLVFPARHNVLMTEAIDHHKDAAPTWDLSAPSAAELRAWSIGLLGKDPPLPAASAKILGASRLEIHDRGAALIGLEIGGDRVTYLVQRARGFAPDHSDRTDGAIKGVAWKIGPYTCIAVGPGDKVAAWRAAFP